MDLRAGEQLLSIGLSLGIENVSQFDIFGNLVDEKGQAWITNLRTIFQFRVRIIFFFCVIAVLMYFFRKQVRFHCIMLL